MQDELWMRNWNDGHPRFSADVDRGLTTLAGAIARLRRRRNERRACGPGSASAEALY